MSKQYPWFRALIHSLKDSNNVIIQIPEVAAVIKDKYPKAKHHFLVICFEDIANIYSLNRDHLPLINEMCLLANNIVALKCKLLPNNFQLGFHREPSMERLHLHVISKDFNSDYLKSAKHWRSFNTKLFITVEELQHELNENGLVQRLSKDVLSALNAAPLQCNQCSFSSPKFAQLKKHLSTHNDTGG